MSTAGIPDLRHVRFEGRPVSPARRERRTTSAGSAPPPVVEPATPRVSGLPRWVLERAGLDPGAYRARPLERRIAACLRSVHARCESDARERLDAEPHALAPALSALLNGVTAFFRDPAVFDTVRERVVPALARRTPLRVWSAGCGHGAELLSIGALLGEAGLLQRARLLGTDCRSEAVAAARAAVYDAVDAPPAYAGLARRFFAAHAGGVSPVASLRERCEWRVADVLRAAEPGPWDLVLWRNVAIYLERQPASETMQRIARELAPGGVLVLGRAEQAPLELGLSPLGRCVYRKPGVPDGP